MRITSLTHWPALARGGPGWIPRVRSWRAASRTRRPRLEQPARSRSPSAGRSRERHRHAPRGSRRSRGSQGSRTDHAPPKGREHSRAARVPRHAARAERLRSHRRPRADRTPARRAVGHLARGVTLIRVPALRASGMCPTASPPSRPVTSTAPPSAPSTPPATSASACTGDEALLLNLATKPVTGL